VATGYVRSTGTWGVNSIPFDKYKSAGIDQVVFAANDPHLAEALKNAAAHGVKAGVWIPAGGEGDPVAYARKIKALQQTYGNVPIIPNIEATGKGYAGSAGWQWSQKMMDELRRLGVPPNMQVAVMGNQDDFNYKAYTSAGVHVTAEAFGASTSDTYDPAKIRQRLIDNGVPPDMVDVMLAPGHNGKGGNSLFTLDDMNDAQLRPGMYSSSGTNTQVAPPGAQQTEGPLVYTNEKGGGSTNAGYTQVTDAQNPRAVKYAQQRLAQLQKQGYRPQDFGITGDPTAQWRAMSSLMGAQQAISSGHAADYHVGADVPPQVADYINKQLAAAQTPNTAPPGDDVIRPGGATADLSGSMAPRTFTPGTPDTSSIAALVAAAAAARRAVTPQPPVQPPAPAAPTHTPVESPRVPPTGPLQPHQMPPPVPAVQRVGDMQKALQTAAALQTLRQLRPSRPVGRD
jgi:hypothetical protein